MKQWHDVTAAAMIAELQAQRTELCEEVQGRTLLKRVSSWAKVARLVRLMADVQRTARRALERDLVSVVSERLEGHPPRGQ